MSRKSTLAARCHPIRKMPGRTTAAPLLLSSSSCWTKRTMAHCTRLWHHHPNRPMPESRTNSKQCHLWSSLYFFFGHLLLLGELGVTIKTDSQPSNLIHYRACLQKLWALLEGTVWRRGARHAVSLGCPNPNVINCCIASPALADTNHLPTSLAAVRRPRAAYGKQIKQDERDTCTSYTSTFCMTCWKRRKIK